MSPTPTRASAKAPAGDSPPKRRAAIDGPANHRRWGRHTRPSLGDDGDYRADGAPLTARAKSFEAKADMIELSPMPEEARRDFFVAGCHARDRKRRSAASHFDLHERSKNHDAALNTEEPQQPG